MLLNGCVDMAHLEFLRITEVTDKISDRRICLRETDGVASSPVCSSGEAMVAGSVERERWLAEALSRVTVQRSGNTCHRRRAWLLVSFRLLPNKDADSDQASGTQGFVILEK